MAYKDKNKQKINIRKCNKTQHDKCRKAILDLLGNHCIRCGFDDVRALQVDHIKGGGSKERKAWKGGNNFYLLKEILNNGWEGKYQLLCANCNWIKRFENNENRQ